MICPNCNSWLPVDNSYCTYCGASTGKQNARVSFFWWLEVVILLAMVMGFYLISTVSHKP
jgi:hypothetical protein